MEQRNVQGKSREELAKDYLRGYQLCANLLNLQRFRRRRVRNSCREKADAEHESVWRAQMLEIEQLVNSLPNCREKMILYYRYILGESVESAADLLDVSRRTGYRLHQRGLKMIGTHLEHMQKSDFSFLKFA